MMKREGWGTLYLCATPIGNLEDITLRVLRTLQEVDYIAAEDTRHTLKLLNHYEIKKPLISCHEHNERERSIELVGLIKSGKSIALVSDAGMPGISDPGYELVLRAIEEGAPMTLLPGPSAALAALVLSGLSTERFVFEGFLPRDKKTRQKRLEALRQEERTTILYEAPHRIKATLVELEKTLGDRRVALARELTKLHEEIFRTTLPEARAYYEEHSPRGEFVIILQGGSPLTTGAAASPDWEGMDVADHLRLYLANGMDKKEAIKRVAKERKLPKNEVYRVGLDL